MVWVILVAALIVIAGAVGIAIRRRRPSPESVATEAPPTTPTRPPEQPMNGLEAALARATDREGRPLGERIDAEQTHVDELRVPDDTGPILRRALDHVERPRETDPTGDVDAAGGSTDDAAPA